MPTDFLNEDQPAQSTSMGRSPRDFLNEDQGRQESLGESIGYAIPRMATDVAKGAYAACQSIPDYLKAAKTEVPGILNPLNFHPLHNLAQAGAGLTELGHNVLNAPRGIADYAANRLNLIPNSLAEKVPYQKDISGDINQAFGAPKYAGDSLIRGATRNALNLMGAGKVADVLNPMNLTAKNIAKDVVNTGETNKKLYSGMYKGLWNDAEQKGFGDALYNVDLNVPVIKKYSPAKGIKGVLDFDNNPTLQNAHAAKSDLLRIQRDLNKLPTLRSAERQQLKAVSEGINNIQNNMFKDSSGKVDNAMLDKYQTIQRGYANEVIPYKNKAINKFKRNEISAPELVNSLSKGEFAAKRGEFHPEIKWRNAFKDHPYLTIGGVGGLGAMLYNGMIGNQQTPTLK